MRLVFLGTGGSIATPERQTTGLYLPDYGILLDIGSNPFPLRRLHGDGPLTILMSHYHIDHSVGLFYLSAGLFYGRSQPEIRVVGPPGWENVQAALGPDSSLWPIDLPFRHELAAGSFRVGEVEVTTRPLPHSAPVCGYRLCFPGGETLAYITDTTAPGDYVEFIRGVDILVHECTFDAAARRWAQVTAHSDSRSVAALARDAGVGTLYLTHVGPLTDAGQVLKECREIFPRTELAIEGLEYPRPVAVDPRVAVFPGSFDPLTVGHLDIVRTCTGMFRRVHVVVARNPAKDPSALFTPDERVELIRKCVPDGVQVDSWQGLTVGYAGKVQAGTIVRGLGRAEDYFSEVRMWKTNALLQPEIRTVWIPPTAENLDVSSSMIKEAALFDGWAGVSHLVPAPIRAEVGERLAMRRAREASA